MPDATAFDVSVVVLAADAADELVDCVKAALDQEGVVVQVVVVDDASSDDTASLGTRIASAHGNVSLVSRIEGGHRTLAWLDGVAASRGEFTLLIDAADRLAKDGLAPLVAIAREQGADLVGSLEGTFRGQLVEAHLMRRVLAELGDADLGPGEDAGILFLLRCLSQNAVEVTDAVVADVQLPSDPGLYRPADLEIRCQARDALSAIATYFDRSEGWDEHRAAWNEFVLSLAARAIAPFPRRVPIADWGEAASMLLDYWGAPLVAAVLSGADDTEQALSAIALGASERLCPRPAKVKRVLLCVSATARSELVERAFGSLGGQAEEVIVVADEHAVLPDDIYQMVSLPLGSGVLPRCQALQAAIDQCEPDAVVFIGGRDAGEHLWDGLVPRAQGLPVGLIADWDEALTSDDFLAYDPSALVDRTRSAAFATATALPPEVDAGPLRLLGLRTATLDTLVAQLSVGLARPMDLPNRLMAMRLLKTATNLFAEREETKAEVAALNESIEAQKLVLAARDTTIAQLRQAAAARPTDQPSPYVVEERKRPWFKDLRRHD